MTKLVNSAYRGEGGWTNESHLLDGARTNEAGVADLILEPDSIILKYVELEEVQADSEEALAGCVYLHKQGSLLYLGMLSVEPTRQGSGIGKDLLEAAVVYAREVGCVKISITVISLRSELVAWYERHGFARTGKTEPFHAGDKFGIQKQPLELVVLERVV